MPLGCQQVGLGDGLEFPIELNAGDQALGVLRDYGLFLKDRKSSSQEQPSYVVVAKPILKVVTHVNSIPCPIAELQEIVGCDRFVPMGIMIAVIDLMAHDAPFVAKSMAFAQDLGEHGLRDVFESACGCDQVDRSVRHRNVSSIHGGSVVDSVKTLQVSSEIGTQFLNGLSAKVRALDSSQLTARTIHELGCGQWIQVDGQLSFHAAAVVHQIAEKVAGDPELEILRFREITPVLLEGIEVHGVVVRPGHGVPDIAVPTLRESLPG